MKTVRQSRIAPHVQVMTYKYKGYVINFVNDVGQVYRLLPFLSQHLDFIVFRPQNQSAQPHMIRQSRGQIQVRQGTFVSGFSSLRTPHCGSRYIVLDEENLSQLPIDSDATDQLGKTTPAEGIPGPSIL
ncbi:hypothetical protein HZ326_21899 [Fusarium oxysporum f. sp. albedinis]|nr:hypothetical protein HZ326_21899 [Fusarium oxysporum f. sp. albedinis]